MLDISTILLHYKRKDIQEAIVECARGREVSIRYKNGGFGKRPDILQYPNDVIELDKQYKQAIWEIMNQGFEEYNERTGHKTKIIPGITFHLDNGLPLNLTSLP